MNINKFTTKPELIVITIDDEDIKTKYNEPDGITFYTYDIVSLKTYFEFATGNQGQHEYLVKLINQMILDADGKPVITDGKELPFDIAAAAIGKLGELLGKSQKPK